MTAQETIEIFSTYLNQTVWVRNKYEDADEPGHRFGKLSGIQQNAILLQLEEGKSAWFNLIEEDPCYEFRLLLKPCSRLSPEVVTVANRLPVSNFIVPYYRSLGFDLPVFIRPGHPANCRNVAELGLADYRSAEEILRAQGAGIITV